jgi:hypothetical protein
MVSPASGPNIATALLAQERQTTLPILEVARLGRNAYGVIPTISHKRFCLGAPQQALAE